MPTPRANATCQRGSTATQPIPTAETTPRPRPRPILIAENTSQPPPRPILIAENTSQPRLRPILIAENASQPRLRSILIGQNTSQPRPRQFSLHRPRTSRPRRRPVPDGVREEPAPKKQRRLRGSGEAPARAAGGKAGILGRRDLISPDRRRYDPRRLRQVRHPS